MIEILVTIIILAIGFLGLASVQLLGAKNIAASNYRTLATIYAYDFAERMRSNPGGISADAYKNITWSNLSNPECDGGCSYSEMANRDAYEWSQIIKGSVTEGGLPSGSGSVAYDEVSGSYIISVSWSEVVRNAETAANLPQTFSLEVLL